MVVGADGSDDRTILRASASLYGTHRLRRVYYSAFSPIPEASSVLPVKAPPLQRENRLYQADWLLRFYGFTPLEISTVSSLALSAPTITCVLCPAGEKRRRSSFASTMRSLI